MLVVGEIYKVNFCLLYLLTLYSSSIYKCQTASTSALATGEGAVGMVGSRIHDLLPPMPSPLPPPSHTIPSESSTGHWG